MSLKLLNLAETVPFRIGHWMLLRSRGGWLAFFACSNPSHEKYSTIWSKQTFAESSFAASQLRFVQTQISQMSPLIHETDTNQITTDNDRNWAIFVIIRFLYYWSIKNNRCRYVLLVFFFRFDFILFFCPKKNAQFTNSFFEC